MSSPKVSIIGAGPGGLSAAMLLASHGFDVTVFEKDDHVGGRCSTLHVGDFKFDIGATMLMMKFILDEVFALSGKKVDDYVEFTRLDPMYRLYFSDNRTINISGNRDTMVSELERVFPEDAAGYDRFMETEKARYEHMMPVLQRDWSSMFGFLSRDTLSAAPYLSVGRSLFSVLSDYFENPLTCLSFTFQAKYLGMSPWDCPGTFALIPYVEHAHGIWYAKGGLGAICTGMARAAEELGVKIRLNTPVRQVITENGAAKGVLLADGTRVECDDVVVNADFSYAATNLFPDVQLKRWAPKVLDKAGYSCSTFMLYLGLGKKYEGLPHHNIIFADDYRTNITDISAGRLTDDFSVYVCNSSATDDSCAPAGKSALYVLVPCPNLRGEIDWEKNKEHYRERTLDILEQRLGLSDIRSHIEVEKVYTPLDWKSNHNVHIGAVFNLAHNIGQMMYFRPHNKFEEVENTWLVGGGTHPGSGLPTIYESGRITARLLCRKYNLAFDGK